MGAAHSVPTPDSRTLKAMELGHINMKELGIFWSAFRSIDKKLTGSVDISDFYKFFEEKRSIFGDAIFELIDCNQSGSLDFGEFVHAVVTYCLFEQDEMLRFCFYIFDKDKNGYIEQEELRWMVNILYGLGPTDKLKGNTKVAVDRLDFNDDGKVDFKEFKEFNRSFPALFYPAFRIQVNMINLIAGDAWWEKKKRWLQDEKDRKRAREEYSKRKEKARLRKMQQRKIRKKMGYVRYFCCFLERKKYELLFPIEDSDNKNEKTAAQLAEERAKAREKAKHLAELAIKNPETEEWHMYKATKGKRKLVKEQRILKQKRPRVKEMDREERKQQRRSKKHHEAAFR
mmetsp:Transcript_91801/g.262514  ORF Transcript_91801/g.262514 Transcript_91801/m.262514 type:complete len:343 (-) Transcript_91801:1358-2386(-)